MAKTFYTERDIEDMAKQGIHSIEVNDDVVLTELAYEKAERLGIKLLQNHEKPPAAPVRPYIAKETPALYPPPSSSSSMNIENLKTRIREATFSRLGNQVDPTLLDTIIQRVLNSVGVE